ncbi:30S ribosomal protein S20 [Spirochaetota bacterium]|nr:30S ribosomal protein S20 [Spirochaetota bacterium]
MPNIKASIIDLRKTQKRSAYNRNIRSQVRTATKKLRLLLEDKKNISPATLPELTTHLKSLYKIVDKSVQKGVLKKNTGIRKKSTFAKKISQIQLQLQAHKNTSPKETPPASAKQ